MNRKMILSAILALVLLFSLCACGGNENPQETTTAPQQTTGAETTAEPTDDGLTEYSVTITDAEGNGVAGAMVQLCDDHGCTPIPTPTGADGKVSTRVAEGTYTVKFIKLPEGYTHADESVAEYPFEDGSCEITIVLAAAQ